MLLTLTVTLLVFAAYQVSAVVHRSQRFSRVAYEEWDIREALNPAYETTVDISESTNGNQKTFKFSAFGKQWRIEAKLNNVFLGNDFAFETRDVNNNVISTVSGSKYRDCFYIGTADVGKYEEGFAAVTSCQGRLYAYINTNLNDYVINLIKPKQLIDGYSWNNDNETCGKPKTSHSAYWGNPIIDRNTIPQPVPRFGREGFVEMGVILDRTFADDFKRVMSNSEEDLRFYVAHIVLSVQTWLLHHTLGWRYWITVPKIIFINNYFPGDRGYDGFSSMTAWKDETVKDSLKWDVAAMLHADKRNTNTNSGLAQPSSTCAGLKSLFSSTHQRFQTGSFIRVFTHELVHTLGAPDDYNEPESKQCFGGLMRFSSSQDHEFSRCTTQEMERFHHIAGNTCFFRENTPSLPRHFTVPSMPVNVAWRAAAQMSTTYESDPKWGAWKLTDGPLVDVSAAAPEPTYASCARTQLGNKPWLQIDIGEANRNNYIRSINIYNRQQCCGNNLKNFEVRVGDYRDHQHNTLCSHQKEAVPIGKNGMVSIKCDQWLKGRYVSVQLMDDNTELAVCEVQVLQDASMTPFTQRGMKCFDKERVCNQWRMVGDCTNDRRSVTQTDCRYSCEFCTRSDMPHLDRSHKSYERHETRNPACKGGDDERCRHFVANGLCATGGSDGDNGSNAEWDTRWRRQCPGYCAPVCDPARRWSPGCDDGSDTCIVWAADGLCNDNYVRTTCRRSCGMCT